MGSMVSLMVKNIHISSSLKDTTDYFQNAFPGCFHQGCAARCLRRTEREREIIESTSSYLWFLLIYYVFPPRNARQVNVTPSHSVFIPLWQRPRLRVSQLGLNLHLLGPHCTYLGSANSNGKEGTKMQIHTHTQIKTLKKKYLRGQAFVFCGLALASFACLIPEMPITKKIILVGVKGCKIRKMHFSGDVLYPLVCHSNHYTIMTYWLWYIYIWLCILIIL